MERAEGEGAMDTATQDKQSVCVPRSQATT